MKLKTRSKLVGTVVAGVLVATPLSAVTLLGGTASAVKAPLVTVACPGSGTATISPGIPISGKPVKQTVTFSGTDADCTNGAGLPGVVTSGTWSGTATMKPVSCTTLFSTGLTGKGSYSETWNDGTSSSVTGMKLSFPPASSFSDAGTYVKAKVTGTRGTGKGFGTVTFTVTDPNACTTAPITGIVINNYNTISTK